MSDPEDPLKQEVAGALRQVRDQARAEPFETSRLPDYPFSSGPKPLPAVPAAGPPPHPVSPDRAVLNQRWNTSEALKETPRGRLGRLFSPLRRPLQRLARFALGPLVERQVELNSALVRFDNELVAYLDGRIDRISEHYDRLLGLHGKRMEEIDERHQILQQELVRHVHELVKRIEFVFETAEQNHLYLDASLRELREEVRALAARLEGSTAALTRAEKERP